MQTKEETLTRLVKNFLEMVRDFQNQATYANELLKSSLKLENPMLWREAGVRQKGAFGQQDAVLYFFHGIGCRVQTGNILVDWDYGNGGRTDGFDFWRLRSFVSDWKDKYVEFCDEDLLKSVFQESINKGLIHQPFLSEQDDLFYTNIAD
jgi:hypothetical protein